MLWGLVVLDVFLSTAEGKCGSRPCGGLVVSNIAGGAPLYALVFWQVQSHKHGHGKLQNVTPGVLFVWYILCT